MAAELTGSEHRNTKVIVLLWWDYGRSLFFACVCTVVLVNENVFKWKKDRE